MSQTWRNPTEELYYILQIDHTSCCCISRGVTGVGAEPRLLVYKGGGAVRGKAEPERSRKDQQPHSEIQDEPLHALHIGAWSCTLGHQQVSDLPWFSLNLSILFAWLLVKQSLYLCSYDSGQCSRGDSNLGLVDGLLNCRQILDAPNILMLHVTSFPFTLQTQYTRISPYNEIHWPSGFNKVRTSHTIYLNQKGWSQPQNFLILSHCFSHLGCGFLSREDKVLWCIWAAGDDPLWEWPSSATIWQFVWEHGCCSGGKVCFQWFNSLIL